jgi:hypothetical protein
MSRTRLRLALGDGAYGPGGVEPFPVEVIGVIPGPDLPNWDHESLLAICEEPFDWHGDAVTYVVISPRYSSDSLSSIAAQGGIVALGRVRPGHDPTKWAHIDASAVHYWAVATATIDARLELGRLNEA